MLLSYYRIKELIPAFNERPLTPEDFSCITDYNEIEVYERALKRRGYYVWDKETDSDFIFLKKTLKGLQWLETAFHELIHALFRDACDFLHSQRQMIANSLSLIALIPLSMLQDNSFLEENPTRHAAKLFKERQRIYFFYGV